MFNYRIICVYSVAGTNQLISAVYHSMKAQEEILETLTPESGSSYIHLLDVMRHVRHSCCTPQASP